MKGFFNYIKTKQGSFRFAGDLFMIAGVMYLNWSPLRIISLFWLDTVVMGIFLCYFITRQFNTSFIFGIPGIFIIGSLMFGFYTEIYKSFHRILIRQIELEELIVPFQPYYETSGILIAIICGHFFDTRYFILLIKKAPQISMNYILVFIVRFIMIGCVMFAIEVLKEFFTSNIKIIIPIIILVLFKQYLEYRIYKVYQRKLAPQIEEEKVPMI